MTDKSLKIHSETAWKIASSWSHVLASDTRTLAAQIDVAIHQAEQAARREENERWVSYINDRVTGFEQLKKTGTHTQAIGAIGAKNALKITCEDNRMKEPAND